MKREIKPLGVEWEFSMQPLERGVLYHSRAITGARKCSPTPLQISHVARLHIAADAGRSAYKILEFSARAIGREQHNFYWYRPHDMRKWKQEAQTILDLLRAGGEDVADNVEVEE